MGCSSVHLSVFTNEQEMTTFICDLITVSKATIRDATWLFICFVQ